MYTYIYILYIGIGICYLSRNDGDFDFARQLPLAKLSVFVSKFTTGASPEGEVCQHQLVSGCWIVLFELVRTTICFSLRWTHDINGLMDWIHIYIYNWNSRVIIMIYFTRLKVLSRPLFQDKTMYNISLRISVIILRAILCGLHGGRGPLPK